MTAAGNQQPAEPLYAASTKPMTFGAQLPPNVVKLGKTRSPFVVWFLTIVTVGIYGAVWYYKINNELRNYNGQIDVSPALAVCNVTIIGLITLTISGLVSFCRTAMRINRAMGSAMAGRCSPVVGIVLLVLVFGTGICYYQARLNRIWSAHGQS